MRESINTIVRGLYFGIGFSLMLFMFLSVYAVYEESEREKNDKELARLQEGQEGMMRIELVISKYTSGGMVTNLRVVNNSQQPAYHYIVETEFFDGEGRFIGECSSLQIKTIQPGKSENIEVFCAERWPEWYKKVKKTEAKFRNTEGSYVVTIKPDGT